MTFNALMLPALPPTAAAALKASDNFGSTAFKSSRPSESTRGSRSFLATLNQVAHRQCPVPGKSTATEAAAEVSSVSGNDPPNSGKTGNLTNDSPNRTEETGMTASAEKSPILDSRRAFRMIHLGLIDFAMADEDSFSDETRSETTDESNSVFPDSLMGYFQPAGQGSLIDWLAGIGPFEQLQANISPEAGNLYLLEQLAAKAASNQQTGDMMGTQAELIGLLQWLNSLSEDTLSNPAASVMDNADTLLGAFLPNQQTVAAASDLNSDTVGTAGQNAAAYQEAIKLEDLLVKMTIPSLPGESDLSEDPTEDPKLAENAKIAGTGKDTPIPLWMPADPNSETLLETPSRPVTENSPLFKINPDVKAAAEQSANPNLVTEGVTTQPSEQSSSIKNSVLNAESLPGAEFNSKITHIEADNKEGGFLFAQDQMPEHLKTLESATRTFEGARSALTPQAMDQIVHKAVLLFNNDQHEVNIELKPEFLGHIRMQIVTENQQVAIKIAAEFPFVKEMLESNLNQLKAALQAQGLQIDALEVSVAHDSHADEDLNQKTAEIAKIRGLSDAAASDDGPSEKTKTSQSGNGEANGEAAIDYFA
jgi:flagellar hook-length control protein FliK